MKNILEAPFMVETVRTLTNLYRLGWDERNGGNLSYLLYDEDIEAAKEDISDLEKDIMKMMDAFGTTSEYQENLFTHILMVAILQNGIS